MSIYLSCIYLSCSGFRTTAPGPEPLSPPEISELSRPMASLLGSMTASPGGSEFIKIIFENKGDTGQGGKSSIDGATLQALIVAAQARGKLAGASCVMPNLVLIFCLPTPGNCSTT